MQPYGELAIAPDQLKEFAPEVRTRRCEILSPGRRARENDFMSIIVGLLLAILLAGAPAFLVYATVRRAPRPLALAVAVALWVFGRTVANPNDPFGMDPVTGEIALLGWRPRWRELLGGACKLAGLAGAAVTGVRIVRGWVRPVPAPPPTEEPEEPREWTCASCGHVVREPVRTCPACGGEIWHPEDGTR